MKSYDQFVNESIVGKLAGFAGRAARGAKKLGGKAANLAGKAAANRHVRTAGSGLRGGLAGLKSYGKTGPVTKAADKGSGFKAGTPGAGLLGTAGKGINQNLKGFQKGTTTGAKHVPGKQISGPTTTPAQRSAGGGVAKSTGGGGVQKTSGGGGVQSTKPNTFTSRLRQKVTDKAKTKIKKTIGYEGDRDKAAALKKAGRTIQKDLKRPKLPAGKPTSGSLPPAKPKTLPSSGGAKPSGGSTPPQSGGGKPTGGSTPQRKDLSKSGGGQTIDVKATPVGKKPTASAGKKPATGSKTTGKPAGKKPSLDDLIKSVRDDGKKPTNTTKKTNKTPVINKGEKKGGALVKSTSNLKAPKAPSKPGDSYPSKAERIAAHKKKVAGLKAKGVKLREELSYWREEFIWETDKKYPDKKKQIKPMSGKNTVIINPEDESAKYSGR